MIQKLLQSFTPQNYELKLDVDSQDMIFKGSVRISGSLPESTERIHLHSKELVITRALINNREATTTQKDEDTLELRSADQLVAGETSVYIEFNGTITDHMHGMYPCYFEHEGVRKKLIATQFESHHAREVFPCIDEPAAKATFDLTLTTARDETVLANTPVKSQKTIENREVTCFETTPLMSTYLLAFVTGEMVYKEAVTKDGVVVRNWASKAQDPAWLDYSVAETVRVIEFYNDYFGVPYPLPKCDQVALPDFEVGAMENWGLIVYREVALLADPNNRSLSAEQYVSLVISHELSHQWFGNLVTMQWWDDLWLNESFASMMEYIALDALHPEWQMWEEYVGQDATTATNRDVYSDVQPVRVDVNDPEEIHALFDPAIVYAKGGKLLKGLHDMLSSEIWRMGLKDYFTTHAYKNTTRDDLWNSLKKASDIDVPALMNTWIEHAGQPLLTVTQEGKDVTITQERLLLDGGSDATLWNVPLLSESLPTTLSEKHLLTMLETSDFVLLNSPGFGHYVVNYTNKEHKKWLAERLADPVQPSTWKIARLNELVMLAKHGDTTLAEALETIKDSSEEPRAAVWSQIGSIIANARMLIEGDASSEVVLKKLSYNLSRLQLEKLGWDYTEGESSNETHLRTTMIGLAIASENDAILQQALKLYSKAKSVEELPSELRGMLMGVAVRFGTPDEFDSLVKTYQVSSNADLKSDICAALCSTRSEERAAQLLEMVLDTTIVRPQDTVRWFVYLFRNRYARATTWKWLTTNWDWVLRTFGGGKSYDDFAKYSASFMNTNDWLEKYQEFFKPMVSDPSLRRAITIGIEEIKAKTAWRERDESAVQDWLEEYNSDRSTETV